MATFNKKTIEDLDVAGKRVLVRCDPTKCQDTESRAERYGRS